MCCLSRSKWHCTIRVVRAIADSVLQADKIEKLEKDHGWHEEEFDFILQFLRTILLKREFSYQYGSRYD